MSKKLVLIDDVDEIVSEIKLYIPSDNEDVFQATRNFAEMEDVKKIIDEDCIECDDQIDHRDFTETRVAMYAEDNNLFSIERGCYYLTIYKIRVLEE